MQRKYALLVAAIAALSACAVGVDEVPADELSEGVKGVIADSAGREPGEVECPEALPAEEGSEVRCTLTDGDTRYGVTVTSKGRDGDQVRFDVQVDDQPQ